jgi:acyl carrier protein
MDKLSILQRIFCDVFDDDALKIDMSTSQEEVEEWDSVAQIKLILSIEEEFGIRFQMEEVSATKNVGEFIKMIERLLDKK